jgi:hypothetical protein
MTSDNRYYCGARGTRTVYTLLNSSDKSSNISGLLLLPSIVVTGYMTSDDHCYSTLLAPTVVTGVLTKVVHPYWPPQ